MPVKVPLGGPNYGPEEINAILEVLMSRNVSMGARVERFEREFAEFLGVKHSVMVNSGSSANLLAMELVRRWRPEKRKNVLTPAITWATTVAPIVQMGMKPVFVDVDPYTLKMDVEAAVSENATGDSKNVYFPVHILGQPSDSRTLADAARVDNTLLIEDACEALGSVAMGGPDAFDYVGTMGLAGTFSFYISHHLQTIEGGMVVTNDDAAHRTLLQLREHGWIRRLNPFDRTAMQVADIDPRFTFTEMGYNVRPTELAGAMGVEQLKKLPLYLMKRHTIYAALRNLLRKHDSIHVPDMGNDASHFALPIMVKPEARFRRDELQTYLEEAGIETRGLIGGLITKQPFLRDVDYGTVGALPGARLIDSNYLMVGLYPDLTREQIQHIVDSVTSFVEARQ